MKTYKDLVAYHLDNGYWSTEPDPRYGYKLSPEPFLLKPNIMRQLKEIGQLTSCYHKGVSGLLDFCGHHGNQNLATQTVYNICKQATDGLPITYPEKNIPIAKVDVMIDHDENLNIAEIDSYNSRPIPVALFLRDIFGEDPSFIGVKSVLKDFVGEKRLVWMYAHRERFYEQIFKQMQRILNQHGVHMVLQDAFTESVMILDEDIIDMVPWGMNWKEELPMREKLIKMYLNQPEKFLYPLSPWLSSKGLLGVISNPTLDFQFEELNKAFFSDSIELLRRYVPPTVVLGKHFPKNNSWFQNKEFILKKDVESGSHGVWFANQNHDEFNKATKLRHSSYIAQESIDQKKFFIPHYGTNGQLLKSDWYLRLTAYIGENGDVIDAKITGRHTPDVHGSLDCIMLPCVA